MMHVNEYDALRYNHDLYFKHTFLRCSCRSKFITILHPLLKWTKFQKICANQILYHAISNKFNILSYIIMNMEQWYFIIKWCLYHKHVRWQIWALDWLLNFSTILHNMFFNIIALYKQTQMKTPYLIYIYKTI